MISPSSPSVQVTSVTRAPSAAYLAIVAPVAIDSSSGCACTSSRLRSTPYPSVVGRLVSRSRPYLGTAAPGVAWHDREHDGELSQAAGADARLPARGTPGISGVTGRCADYLPAVEGRRRPRYLPVGGRRRHRRRAARAPPPRPPPRPRETPPPRNRPAG